VKRFQAISTMPPKTADIDISEGKRPCSRKYVGNPYRYIFFLDRNVDV
jgi:hypothetical protein